MASVELVGVAVKMLGTHVMVDSDEAAFEQSPVTFQTIRVNSAMYVFLRAVVDRLMLAANPNIGGRLVRVHCGVGRSLAVNEILERRLVR